MDSIIVMYIELFKHYLECSYKAINKLKIVTERLRKEEELDLPLTNNVQETLVNTETLILKSLCRNKLLEDPSNKVN